MGSYFLTFTTIFCGQTHGQTQKKLSKMDRKLSIILIFVRKKCVCGQIVVQNGQTRKKVVHKPNSPLTWGYAFFDLPFTDDLLPFAQMDNFLLY